MSFENYFPLWNDLNTAQKKLISDNLITQHVKKGTIIHNGNMDCTGLLLIKSGQLRTYIPVSYTHLDVYKRQVIIWSPFLFYFLLDSFCVCQFHI